MPEVKFPKASVIWTFNLRESEIIDPPVLKLELTPLNSRERQEYNLLMADVFAGTGDLKALAAGEQSQIMTALDAVLPFVLRHIIGWDLAVEGKPIPCTDEEKARPWFEDLLREFVEPEKPEEGQLDPGDKEEGDEPEARWLWFAVMQIIENRGNFSKN